VITGHLVHTSTPVVKTTKKWCWFKFFYKFTSYKNSTPPLRPLQVTCFLRRRKVRREMEGHVAGAQALRLRWALCELRRLRNRLSWLTVSFHLAPRSLTSPTFPPPALRSLHTRTCMRGFGSSFFAAAAGCEAAGWDGRSWRARVQVPARSKLCLPARPPGCGAACRHSTCVVLVGIVARSGQFC
jgi:hypothetical protein